MNEYSGNSNPPHAYLLGHSQREIDRLKAQARLVDPITKRFFSDRACRWGAETLRLHGTEARMGAKLY